MDKRYDIANAGENEFGRSIPADVYGYAKYIMNEIAGGSGNVYNLRLFACYGPYDHHSKFITHAIRSCMRNVEVTIRQDCCFDYVHVYDLANLLIWFLGHSPRRHDYNICSGKKYLLSEIAENVIGQMGSNKGIRFLNEGLNLEYTACNARLLEEAGAYDFISIDEGIKIQIAWERENWGWDDEKKSC
jgi:GDP-L-fucose synthase